jgi:hypothetical protein
MLMFKLSEHLSDNDIKNLKSIKKKPKKKTKEKTKREIELSRFDRFDGSSQGYLQEGAWGD